MQGKLFLFPKAAWTNAAVFREEFAKAVKRHKQAFGIPPTHVALGHDAPEQVRAMLRRSKRLTLKPDRFSPHTLWVGHDTKEA